MLCKSLHSPCFAQRRRSSCHFRFAAARHTNATSPPFPAPSHTLALRATHNAPPAAIGRPPSEAKLCSRSPSAAPTGGVNVSVRWRGGASIACKARDPVHNTQNHSGRPFISEVGRITVPSLSRRIGARAKACRVEAAGVRGGRVGREQARAGRGHQRRRAGAQLGWCSRLRRRTARTFRRSSRRSV
jgi:hypothetical protein